MISIFLAAISTFQLINILLLMTALFIGFRIIETTWSYKISKPYAWDTTVKEGTVPDLLKKIESRYRDKVRFYTFWFQIERLKKENVPGAFAEVGVYKGETARMIHAMDPSRVFHLFDTFTGFSKEDLQAEKSTEAKYSTENFSDTSIETVKAFIKGNEQIQFHAGYFPGTTQGLTEKSYAFVHIDADLYSPTIAALTYFYPKLSPGGVIMVHDYNHTWEGAERAIREFTAGIPEVLVEVCDWQGSILIVRNRI